MNKTTEQNIKRTIANEMNVKSAQVMLEESWSIETTFDCSFNECIAFNIRYNLYTNEGYKANLFQYRKNDKMIITNIKVAKQYRL